MDAPDNSYLGEVLQQQQKVDMELRRKAPMAASPVLATRARMGSLEAPGGFSETGARAVDFRITGWWRWKTVVVPPNVYVVHTRRGHKEPLHVGMGVSFRFNPTTDAFLIIPAAMQTIVINARCICVERQGILVQAYVQWIIDDIATAYRRLDFSDTEDPMRIVNVQLREQAEAAIKDKVATMRIDEVLADKQPIIEELTLRLRGVAEGSRDNGAAQGLGLKIVTVQIKEAVVSSTRLWQNLQSPFRAERERLARMAQLETERQITERELEIRHARETAEITAAMELERQRALQEREAFDRTQSETARRAAVQLENERHALLERNATEKAKRDAELELALKALEIERRKLEAELVAIADKKQLALAEADLARARLDQEILATEQRSLAAAAIARREIDQLRARRSIDNDVSETHLRSQMIAALPEIASQLPVPKDLKSVQISSDGTLPGAAALLGLLESLLAVLESRREHRASKE